MDIAITQSNTIAATSFSTSLFDAFIAFIDRPGRTEKTYLTNLKQFAAWLKYEQIEQPQRADIINFRDYLGKEHKAIVLSNETAQGWKYRTDKQGNYIVICCKANTVKQYLQSVKQFFRWTASENLYPNIAENIHPPKIDQRSHRKEALSASDVFKIEQSIIDHGQRKQSIAAEAPKDSKNKLARATEQQKRLYAMYLLAVNCGLRTIEISRANIRDLETIKGTVYLYIQGKGHTEADTKKTLAPGVYDAIQDYLSSRSDKYNSNSPLFVSTGNRSQGKRIAPETIGKMLKAALKEAGYNSDRLTAHSLRHTAGTAAMRITNNIYETQKYMRHENPGTTEIYLHTNDQEQETELAYKLFEYYHAQEPGRKMQSAI